MSSIRTITLVQPGKVILVAEKTGVNQGDYCGFIWYFQGGIKAASRRLAFSSQDSVTPFSIGRLKISLQRMLHIKS